VVPDQSEKVQKENMPDPAQARARVSAALPREAGVFATPNLTPAFPAAWPPDGRARAVYFAYAFAPQPTSQDLVLIYSPHTRLELDLLAGPGAPVAQTHLETRELKPLEPSDPDSPEGRTTLERAERELFGAIAGKSMPAAPAAEVIRAGYRAWFSRRQALRGEMERLLPDFVGWLELP